nr:hypothetical protein [Tanacetum cinerariifolium]
SEVAQESEADTVKRFDLNQEVCSEEVDNPVNPVSSTISVVSASQPSAASGLSSTPLQFEGILGLKESISTSALKPIIDGTHNNSKQRLDCLDFDLNAADGREDKTLPSGEESSVEANPRGPTKMQLVSWMKDVMDTERYMMVNQDMDAAPQDVKNLNPLGDDETRTPSISPADKIINNENNVDKSISETMPVASDKVMETETTNHELQDQGDPFSKLTNDGANLLDKPEVSSSKERYMMVNQDMDAAPQDVKNLKPLVPVASDEVMETETTNHELQAQGDPLSKLTHDGANLLDEPVVSSFKLEDEKESKIEDKTELVEMSTSSPLEQVDNPLESSTKTDDKDQDLVDNNDIPETESQKTSTDSEIVKDDDNVNGNDSRDDNVNGNDSHLFKSSVNSKTLSYVGLDSRMMDPLEVARQVAMEVERDVDSLERSCGTTSDKTTDSKIGQKSQCKPDGQESRSQPPLVKDAKTLVSQVSEMAQESEADTVKGFDQNQEVCSEEVENHVNPVSKTISFVSASQPSAASGLSSTPLQFEGILGLKESISTSALKPIIDGTHNNSKQRLDCIDFDLNAADGRKDKTLPSGEESSVEANPRGPTKMQLDLNSIMDEGCDGHVTFVNQTRWQSPSRSSSSSSKQPSLKNIDLNLRDQPESVVRIFGSKFGVKKNDPPVQPTVSNLVPTQYGHNGFASEAAMFFPTPMETNSVLRRFLPQNGNEQYLRTRSPSGSIVGGKRHVPD